MSDNRLHPMEQVDNALMKRLCEPYGLVPEGFSVLSGGLINTNVKVETAEGPVLLRIYISERTCEQVEFEMSVLKQLHEQGLPVQRPRSTVNGALVSSDSGRHHVVLDFVPGTAMDDEDLDDRMAADIGRFVAHMHEALDGFVPRGSRPSADTAFIDTQLDSLAELEGGYRGVQNLWPAIRDYFNSRDVAQGVVHADIYPGNIIVDETNRLRAVIDFDDCYWGTQVFDLAIVTMAFSFIGACGHDWRRAGLVLGAYEAVRGPIDSQDLYLSMILNCVRFYVYTLPLTRAEGREAIENPFARRAAHLVDATTRTEFFTSREL
ncbi:Ser/Thr protein kinase RdoA (MazF antagonist) [Sanguibacter antarcticus]|uniref:Ser/Thr protein kinase RdoA (MazF antagonist) n=2 Tax=Sanguibacter antarcticus TaxID=372484 RepID=A0A2A9E881_9MICO|nr:Ser/Thr protein kinase RdoA (MazF antagonist) [Sanguibacter antarcticus]